MKGHSIRLFMEADVRDIFAKELEVARMQASDMSSLRDEPEPRSLSLPEPSRRRLSFSSGDRLNTEHSRFEKRAITSSVVDAELSSKRASPNVSSEVDVEHSRFNRKARSEGGSGGLEAEHSRYQRTNANGDDDDILGHPSVRALRRKPTPHSKVIFGRGEGDYAHYLSSKPMGFSPLEESAKLLSGNSVKGSNLLKPEEWESVISIAVAKSYKRDQFVLRQVST